MKNCKIMKKLINKYIIERVLIILQTIHEFII